jgi:DNA-directed RNA polymerase subunit beta'
LVDDGEYVEPGMVLATPKPKKTKKDAETTDVAENLVSTMAGRVQLSRGALSIVWEDVEEREHMISRSALLLVNTGDEVTAGQALTQGPLNPHDILNIRGKDELQKYLVDEVQQVYRSQGVAIHDKHIEIILRQMLRRVQVESTGDTELIPGQMVDKFEFQDRNARVLAEGGEPATAKPMLLGVTRASLLTDSFLAAASFQETTRVLTQAAVSGAHDWLLGLKENVIIGRLIPAQVDSLQMEEEALPEPVLSMVESSADDWLEIASQGLGPIGASPDVGSDTTGMISVVDEEVENRDTEGSDDEDIDLNGDADSPNIFSPTEE